MAHSARCLLARGGGRCGRSRRGCCCRCRCRSIRRCGRGSVGPRTFLQHHDGTPALIARAYELGITHEDVAALQFFGGRCEVGCCLREDDVRCAVRRAPQNADTYSALAIALIHTKDYTGAWNTLADGAAIAPANTDILINQILLQACLKDMGNKKK